MQNQTLGHRGHKDDPLYRCRRLLAKADERLGDQGRSKLVGLLKAGDPHGEVRTAWHAKEVLRSVPGRDLSGPPNDRAAEPLDLRRTISVLEVLTEPDHELGRQGRVDDVIDRAQVSNGSTEADNNLVKRVKRVAFGFASFENYRIRALLCAGKPNWDRLASVTPHSAPSATCSSTKVRATSSASRATSTN